jgi:hypothetical protein
LSVEKLATMSVNVGGTFLAGASSDGRQRYGDICRRIQIDGYIYG